MNPAEYIVAIVGPVGLVVGLVWKLQKNPKAAEMLKISGLMSLLFLIGPLIYKQYATEKKQKSGPMASTVVDRNAPMPRPNRDEDEDPPERGRRATESDINAPKPADLAKYPAEIQRAMRSTVCILAGGGLGTGVIVQQDGNLGYVITNRHVVDQVFFASHGAVQTSASKLPTVKVKFVTDEVRPGKVVWLAGEIDLAIVEVACPKGVEIADIKLMPDSNVGDEVFAVGTPMGLGWTFTKGTISAFRDREYGPKKVSVVQTDARIGPGNSGGGLFSKKGDLLGINTFVMSGSRESAGETGLGFAIKKTLLAELKPEMLNFIPPKK